MKSDRERAHEPRIGKPILIAGLGILTGFVIQLLIISVNNESDLITKRRAVAQTTVSYEGACVSYLRSDVNVNRIRVEQSLDRKRIAEIDLESQKELNKLFEMESQIEGDIVLFFADDQLIRSFANLKKNFHGAINITNHRAVTPQHIANQEAAIKPYLDKFIPLTSDVLSNMRPFLERKVLFRYSALAFTLLMVGLIGYVLGSEATPNQLP